MIVAVHQPQYLPWLGYFDKIDRAHLFVLLDIVQFKKNEWQNRNRIKTAQGWQWLTVPVTYRFPQRIDQVKINLQSNWARKHLLTLKSNYYRAPYFSDYFSTFENILTQNWQSIATLNIRLVRELTELLGISTPLRLASELGDFPEEPDERLIAICKHLGAEVYLAGLGGRNYMNLEKFRKAGIEVVFQEFKHPVFPQLYGDFLPNLSVVDLLFNCGEQSLRIIRETRKEE
ncbi:MAG: WbqC family protein [Candidatus Latescibacteria bacterium]|nr:WbqC family protein [Candidatus Latescibacterota bacterium]